MIEFKYVDLKAPRKMFKKDKETGDVHHVTRISFDVVSVDDETLMAITHCSEGIGAKVTIDLGE